MELNESSSGYVAACSPCSWARLTPEWSHHEAVYRLVRRSLAAIVDEPPSFGDIRRECAAFKTDRMPVLQMARLYRLQGIFFSVFFFFFSEMSNPALEIQPLTLKCGAYFQTIEQFHPSLETREWAWTQCAGLNLWASEFGSLDPWFGLAVETRLQDKESAVGMVLTLLGGIAEKLERGEI